MQYKITSYGYSDIGLVRKRNEDMWAELPEHKVFVLADGMGGHRAGDVAASETVFNFCELLRKKLTASPSLDQEKFLQVIEHTIDDVNQTIYQMSIDDALLEGMGTTFCCMIFRDDQLIHAHVGDSRIYRLQNGNLEQLTEDHSLVQELIGAANMSQKEAEDCASKSIITKAIGTEKTIAPSLGQLPLSDQDIFLMCSDGLTDYVSFDEIKRILISNEEQLAVGAKELIQVAKKAGGADNITAVLVKTEKK